MPRRSLSEGGESEFVEHVAETLDIGPGTEVFEVACGAGEFLTLLHDNQYPVGGIDADPALIAKASEAMPRGRFAISATSELDPSQPWHVVICRAFGGFPNTDYARGVLARMSAKATHAVALLEVPEDRFDRKWMLRAFAEIGVTALQFEDGKDEAHYNVFARL